MNDRGQNQRHHGRTHALEHGLDDRLVLERNEKQRHEQYDDERRYDDTEHRAERPPVTIDLVADENRRIESQGSRRSLGERQQVEEFLAIDPRPAIDHFLFDQRNHGVSPAEGKYPDLEERPEKIQRFPHKVFSPVIRPLARFRPFPHGLFSRKRTEAPVGPPSAKSAASPFPL